MSEITRAEQMELASMLADKNLEIDRLRAGFGALLKEYFGERDCIYDSMVNSEGEFDTQEDKDYIDDSETGNPDGIVLSA